jgi:copper homeostasis protein (lipoprotein)
MTASIRTALLAAAIAAVFAAGCRRDEPEPSEVPEAATADTPATPAPATVPGTDVSSVSENTPAEAGVQPAGDPAKNAAKRDFAGTFAADGASLTLQGDGSYRMAMRAESAGAELESDGTFELEDDGKHLLLDPNSKDEPDRRFAVVSPDELRAVDGGQVLRRESR